MPRIARVKAEDKIFHIMVRSIKEVPLLADKKDKELYMSIVAGYQKIYGFKVYAYCLMDNHAHFIIDVNGADISNIMHSINFKYAIIFNKRHGRYAMSLS
jgi:putative transposase